MRTNRKRLAHYWPTAHRTYFSRHTPSGPVTRTREELNRIFTGMSPREARKGSIDLREGVWTPPVDKLETDEAYFFHLDLPGVTKEDVNLRLEGRKLLVSGRRRPDFEKDSHAISRRERVRGRFYRAFNLPEEVNADGIEAKTRDGVLIIRLPKTREAQENSTRISID